MRINFVNHEWMTVPAACQRKSKNCSHSRPCCHDITRPWLKLLIDSSQVEERKKHGKNVTCFHRMQIFIGQLSVWVCQNVVKKRNRDDDKLKRSYWFWVTVVAVPCAILISSTQTHTHTHTVIGITWAGESTTLGFHICSTFYSFLLWIYLFFCCCSPCFRIRMHDRAPFVYVMWLCGHTRISIARWTI